MLGDTREKRTEIPTLQHLFTEQSRSTKLSTKTFSHRSKWKPNFHQLCKQQVALTCLETPDDFKRNREEPSNSNMVKYHGKSIHKYIQGCSLEKTRLKIVKSLYLLIVIAINKNLDDKKRGEQI